MKQNRKMTLLFENRGVENLYFVKNAETAAQKTVMGCAKYDKKCTAGPGWECKKIPGSLL